MSSVFQPGKLSGSATGKNIFSATAHGAHCCLQWYSDQIINVRFSRSSVFQTTSYAVIREPMETAPEFVSNGDEFISTGEFFSVIISKANALIRFVTPLGDVINADEPGLGTCWNGDQVTAYKHLQEGERFIGLGEKVGPLDRRGRGYVHYNTDAFAYGSGTDPIYSTIPFYIGIHSGLVYGIFFDNSSRTTFNFGASNNRFSSFSADVGEMNYYFIHGQTVAEIISAYTWLTGTTPLPPRWSLGLQQCRYSYYPESEVLNLARNFRERDIPADALVLDIHHMDAYKVCTWHPEHFPNPERMISQLREQGFHVVVICDPGIKVEEGYQPYEEGKDQELFIRYPDGKDYEGQVWPGWCHFPDFTNPKTRDAWARWMKFYTDAGVEGFWNDMGEFSTWGQMMPENLLFHFEGDSQTSRTGRNVYGLQMARSTYEGTRAHLKGSRPFNLTRSGYAGIQRYAALWTGDNVSYDEHMLLGVRLVNSLGLCGVAFSGYDIGGFVGEASSKLFARWITIGVFSPFCRVHSMINSRDSEPWSYGEETEIISRNYLRMRYQLMPYIYSLFNEASVSGMPVQRSLAISYPHQPEVFDGAYENQYLFGPDILVVPVESHKDLVKVYFPKGLWYNLNDGERIEGGTVRAVECPVHRLPVYVRAGAVIPMQDPVAHTGIDSETLHLHIYHGGEGTDFTWYTDDGQTYAFEQGEYCMRTLSFNGKDKLTVDAAQGTYKPSFSRIRLVLHGFESNTRLSVNGVNTSVVQSVNRFFQPMEKFDPLGDAPEVGSEPVLTAFCDYTSNLLKIVFTNR